MARPCWLICLAAIATIGADVALGQANCPNGDQYSPCTCAGTVISPSIACAQVPFANVSAVFGQTQPVGVAISIELRPASNDVDTVPANVLGDKKAKSISFRCPSTDYQLRIHQNAFVASRDSATRVTLNYCDLSALSLFFLNSFNNLTYLGFSSSVGLQTAWPTLPYPLPALVSLNFYSSRGLNETFTHPSVLANGITDADFGSCNMDDAASYRVLDWLVRSSNTTLKTLYMDGNYLTQVPPFIPSFKALNILELSFNNIASIQTGQLQFTAPVSRLALQYNNISRIESNAFQGNFSKAQVILQNNPMTQFDQFVFHGMLEQMAASTGLLYLSGNPFDCASNLCIMSWALSSNRGLLRPLDQVKCSNGTLFTALNANEYRDCPFVCPRTIGYFQYSDCSASFYQCANNQPYLQNCSAPTTLAFNPALNACDYRSNVAGCQTPILL